MSLAEVQGTARANLTQYGATQTVTQHTVSPAYVSAVKAVQTAPKGTVISTAPKVVTAVPKVVTNAISDPLGTAVGTVLDFWGLVLGSREQKVTTIGKYIPAAQTYTDVGKTVTSPMNDVIQKMISVSKTQSPAAKTFWETPTFANTNIELPKLPALALPDFGGILGKLGDYAKWILIGGAALIGVYFISKMGKSKE